MSDASGVKRYGAHALIATAFVLGLPAAVVWALIPAGSLAWSLVSVPLAIVLSVVVASAGSAIWARRPGSRDLIFADLMLWGWARRVRAERRLAEAREVLGTAFGGAGDGLTRDDRVRALSRLSGLLEARDAYTHRHTSRVTRHAERIARAMRLPPAEVAQVRTAAALHDVGKIHTPRAVLNKPGRLTDAEFAVIRRHPVDGADMLAGIGDPEITAMVRHHHERLDGGGYPDGLTGAEIPLGARIIAVADTFDAMTSSRSYRGACSHRKALEVLAKESGAQLDPDAVGAFLGYYSARRSVAWSAVVTTAPQRLLGLVGTGSQGLGSGAASVSQLLPAVGAAAALAAAPGSAPGSVGSPAIAELAAGPAHTQRPAAAGSAGTEAERERRAERAEQPAPARRAPGDRRRPRVAAPTKTSASVDRADAPGTDARSGGEATADRSGSAATPRSDATPGSDATPAARGPDPGPTVDQAPAPAPVPDPKANPVPKVDVPAVEVPAVEVPAVEVPAVEVPPVKLPPVELPAVRLPAVELPPVKLPALETPRVQVPGVEIKLPR